MIDSRFTARVDSSDVVQDAMTQACRDAHQFRGQTEGEWVQWLRRILVFQATKLRRRHSADKRSIGREAASRVDPAIESSDGPLQTIIERDQLAHLAEAVEQLNANMREVVMRRVFDQQSFDDVAHAMQCTPAAARVTWTRAIRKLRTLLDQHNDNSSMENNRTK